MYLARDVIVSGAFENADTSNRGEPGKAGEAILYRRNLASAIMPGATILRSSAKHRIS